MFPSEYLILADDTVELITNKFKLTVGLWIKSFFVLNTEHTKKSALTLEFVQRCFFKCECDK